MSKPQLWAFLVPTTDQDAPIGRFPDADRIVQRFKIPDVYEGVPQHLHIIEFGEPKVGDYITDGRRVYSNDVQLDGYIGIYRIVASTDAKLGLTMIGREVLMDFIRSNSRGWTRRISGGADDLLLFRVDEKQFEINQAIDKPKTQHKWWITLRKILIWVPGIGILWGFIEGIMLCSLDRSATRYNFFKGNGSLMLLSAVWLGLTAIILELIILCQCYQSNLTKP